MSHSRREFLAGLATAGALAAVPRAARASLAGRPMYPSMNLSAFAAPLNHGEFEVRAGCSAITWSDNAAKAIEEIAESGFAGIQLRAPVLDQYSDPHQLRDLLAQHKLTFVALSSGQASIDPTVRKQQVETHVKHAHYVREAGGLYLQLVAAAVKPTGPFPAADCKLQGEVFTEIGKAIADHGIKLGFHNHMNTVGQPPEAVDAILDASDPKYLHLELDVAHYLQGGGDPAACIRKHARRLLFLHFKDVSGPKTPTGYEFCELGSGRVDLPAIFAALKEVKFRGWGIVELDRVPKNDPHSPKEANALSLHLLREKYGVKA